MSMFSELFCKHKYKTVTREMRHLDENGDPHYTEFIIVQVCQKCGKVKVTHVLPASKQKIYGYGCKGVK